MKHWKRILKWIAVASCIGMLAGCGEKTDTPVVPTPTATSTPMPTATSTPVPTATSTPVPTATSTPMPTATNTPVPTATSIPMPAATNTPMPTATNTPVPAATNTPVPTATSTPVPTATSTPVPTATSTPVPTATSTPAPTVEPTKAPVANEDMLTGLTAFDITSQMIVGWNLGNVLDSTGSNITYDSAPAKAATAWGNEEPAKEQFEAVKAAGFNTVRIPTTWYQHVKFDGGKYIINPDWLAYVKKTVDYAYDLDLFVILNVHHEDWVNVGQFTDATYQTASQMLADIWGQVAETFKDYDQHLIFEGMNEPRQTGLGGSVEWGGGDTASWKYINDLNKVFVTTVRGNGSAANKERLLMLPGYGASSNIPTVKSIEIPAGSGNVALSVHGYLPYFFAMATDSYANHSFPGKSGYGENYESSITTFFSDLKKVSDSKNVPIIIGEFGASDFNNPEDRARWATHYLTCAKKAGIPCVLWDNQATYNGSGEAHGYLYRATCTWFENSIPMLKAMMDVYGQKYDLPVYQAYVKPAFDWNNIGMTSDWVQIFRSEAGQKVDDWGNIWLDNWKSYVNEQYDIVLVYDSEAEPYMVLQGGWYKVRAGEPGDGLYTIRFTYEDVQNTMQDENVKLEDMTGFFASANGKPMTVYGVYAVPAK